ncbi:MAG: heme exporter protein CcmB [Ignavibacteria bacterium]|nr:heme exporter protein CcmB [Ignavibacteria bacterium]
MDRVLTRITAVAVKDLRSEARTRFGITALGLFILTTVALIAFSTSDEILRKPIASAMLWVLMVFTAFTGLGRSFISEEERGTALFLRLNASAEAVFFGKLMFNCLLSLSANLLAAILFLFFLSIEASWSAGLIILTVTIGSVGLSSVLTIISAIVAKAGSRNTLLPALSFPMLVPIIMPGVDSMLMAFAGMPLADAAGDLVFILSYAGIVTLIGYFVFDIIWSD